MTVNGKLADVAAPAAARGRAGGPATVLAMGTATPANCLLQSEYSDFYFNSTNSEHMSTELKNKFTRICEKSGVEKRYFHVTEELLKSNPTMQEFSGQSLDIRQEITVEEIPKLGGAAARKAIAEWGRPLSSITHLVFCSTGGMNLPGADWALTNLLGLRPDIRRTMLYSQGCFGGGTSLRMAKDLAENNKGARVLVVCAEMTVVLFRAPNEDYIDTLVGQALFSDGASALIVGSDPIPDVETPWFEVHWAGSYILPKSETAVTGEWKQIGLTFHLDKRVPQFVSENLPSLLKTAIDNVPDEHDKKQLGPNDIFWIAHPGGPAILAQIETSLDLQPHKFESTKKVLAEYGNMSSACVFFVMDQVRRNSLEKKLSTTGEGCKWGLLMSFGPGITCETLVLKSVPL